MNFKDLIAYKKAFQWSMNIYRISKRIPKEKTCSLTDQIGRSSRSVCANTAEANRKRLYVENFIRKLTDAENSETSVWLDFAVTCDYFPKTNTKNCILKPKRSGNSSIT